jgi:hypothetical protein
MERMSSNKVRVDKNIWEYLTKCRGQYLTDIEGRYRVTLQVVQAPQTGMQLWIAAQPHASSLSKSSGVEKEILDLCDQIKRETKPVVVRGQGSSPATLCLYAKTIEGMYFHTLVNCDTTRMEIQLFGDHKVVDEAAADLQDFLQPKNVSSPPLIPSYEYMTDDEEEEISQYNGGSSQKTYFDKKLYEGPSPKVFVATSSSTEPRTKSPTPAVEVPCKKKKGDDNQITTKPRPQSDVTTNSERQSLRSCLTRRRVLSGLFGVLCVCCLAFSSTPEHLGLLRNMQWYSTMGPENSAKDERDVPVTRPPIGAGFPPVTECPKTDSEGSFKEEEELPLKSAETQEHPQQN